MSAEKPALAEMLRQAAERRHAFHEGFRRKMAEQPKKSTDQKEAAPSRAPGGAK